MWKNYIKIAFRQLWKHRLFSALNIFGLATSMSVCLLLIMIINDQYSYDNFHEKGDRIYRVISAKAKENMPLQEPNFATTSLALREDLKTNYPFIEETVRLFQVGNTFEIGEKKFDTNGRGYVVDAAFLNMFDFGWKAGNKSLALQNPRSIVLTETTAATFFGDQDPLGETVTLEELGEFTITGLLPDPPIRSHIRFDYLMSYSTVETFTEDERQLVSLYEETDIWRGFVYLLLDARASESQLDRALSEQAAAFSERDDKHHYLFQSQELANVMPSQNLSNEIGTATPRMVLFFLIALGVLIILAACFNYMNLSIARSLERAKEIGIRKVTGAQRRDIIFQFLGEAVMLAVMALIVAIVLLEFLIPAFYGLDPFVGDIFHLTKTPALYLTFFGFSLIVGLLAGIFPAFNISAYKPIQAIQKLSTVKLFSRVGIRKALVTAQFALSLIFIMTVVFVLLQQKHVLEADLGVNFENVLNVRLQKVDYEIFEQQISQIQGVESVSACSNVLLTGENSNAMARFNEGADSVSLHYNFVSSNFLENMHIKLVAGRQFPESNNSQGEQFIILNEKATQRMGFEQPSEALGATVAFDTTLLTVIGVTADFHHDNIWFEPIKPYGFRQNSNFALTANIRLNEANVSETVKAIHASWDVLSPNQSVYSFFTDERVYYMTKFFRMGSKIIGFVGILTIIITCLGLLGMVIYTIEGRIKEVGIRKVLGASERNIIWQLSKGFFLLFGIAIGIAIPITFFGANLWLQNFLLRITIQPWMFLIGIGIMLSLGLLTVVSQTFMAARSNPVESLRNE